MKARLLKTAFTARAADAWLVFTFKDEPALVPGDDAVAHRLGRMLAGWRERHHFTGRRNEAAVIPCWDTLPARSIVLAGLGARRDFHPGRLRQAAASAARLIRQHRIAELAVSLRMDLPAGAAPGDRAALLAGALHYGGYHCARHFTGHDERQGSHLRTVLFTDAPAAAPGAQRGLDRAVAAAEALAAVRDAANLPPNEAPPAALAAFARRLARRHGLACAVLNKTALTRKGCGALLAVARGSRQEPRLIILTYRGARPLRKPVLLVGKTITFDTGGISLKPAKGMEWMKYDKGGGMAVLGALAMAAELRLAQPVIGILAAAENMPGGDATRPGDIIRSYAGKTIEVLNTDAEGRLVLADALALAAERQPAAIVDLATLTGASIVAMGHVLSPIMANRPELAAELQAAGEACGERLWPLPLLPDYEEDLRSSFADLRNVGEHGAGTILGGAFLRQFVPESIPWAHIDIANTAHEESAKPYAPRGATMFGATLLVEWLKHRDRATS